MFNEKKIMGIGMPAVKIFYVGGKTLMLQVAGHFNKVVDGSGVVDW